MMSMNWLCIYNIEEEFASSFKIFKKTARKWIWIYMKAIQALKVKKVSNDFHWITRNFWL